MKKHRYTIEISIIDPDNATTQNELWKLLELIDHEFIPPLSTRESTTEMILGKHKQHLTTGPQAYFQKILGQHIIMARVEAHWAGFLSFRHNDTLELLGEQNPCNYLTTIGVSPYYRNMGIARAMYRYALKELPAALQSPYWVTRTWSTNDDHLHLLKQIGFTLAARLVNHRGTDIDTQYYIYKMP